MLDKDLEDLFNRSKKFQDEIQEASGIVQNEGMTYTQEQIEMFDISVKQLIVDLGVWKQDVLEYLGN